MIKHVPVTHRTSYAFLASYKTDKEGAGTIYYGSKTISFPLDCSVPASLGVSVDWFRSHRPVPIVEEDKLPHYDRSEYHPMRIVEIFKDPYQVVAKVGYGGTSTVWLSYDLR
jgi:hypothetical protein